MFVGLRRRLPLLASLLLVLTCLMAVGVVCTCSSDQSLQTIQRIVQGASSSAALPARVVVSNIVVFGLGMLLVGFVLMPDVAGRGRASPQVLQRFLF
jgi:hypothetical protein